MSITIKAESNEKIEFSKLKTGDVFSYGNQTVWYMKLMDCGKVRYFNYEWNCIIDGTELNMASNVPCFLAKRIEHTVVV